jgi:hypothetical protein
MYTQDDNGLYPGGASVIPPSMRIETNGTYSATTVGFHQASATTVGGLIAPSFISLVSILIVLVMLAKSKGTEPEANHYFDPGDVLHLISAASAGGMQTPFPPFSEIETRECKGVRVKLAPVKGVRDRIGFIDVNEYHLLQRG